MVIVDSSGWIEYFTSGRQAAAYQKHLKDPRTVITPTIILYEVYKKIKREISEEAALEAVSAMKQSKVVPLTESISLLAADLSIKHSLPMADAIVYASALEMDCTVITSDGHFKGLDKAVLI
jgi:predicted nucleic acid-binding protein